MADNFDLRKFLTENKLTSNAKRLSVNEASDPVYVVDGKEVDFDSIKLGQMDHGDGPEWTIESARFIDGTELDIDQLEDLYNQYYADKDKGVSPDFDKKYSDVVEVQNAGSPEEVVKFIIQRSSLEETTLEEALDISGIISRTKQMARKALLTPVAVAMLLAYTPQEAHAQIKNIAAKEAGVDVNNLPKVAAKQTTSSDPIKQIQSVLKGTKSMNTSSKVWGIPGPDGRSLNWGANAPGGQQASVGLSVVYTSGSPYVEVIMATVPGKSSSKFNELRKKANELAKDGGKQDTSSTNSATIKIKKEKINDIILFLQSNVDNL